MILYHQTAVRFLNSILTKGLIPREPDEWKTLLEGVVPTGTPVIWFTDSIREKGSYLHSSQCLLQVDTLKLDARRLVYLSVDGWWVYTGIVLPEFLKLVDWRLYRKKKPKFLQELQKKFVEFIKSSV